MTAEHHRPHIPAAEWEQVVPGIVDGWLFADVPGELPPVAVLPMENPHLYDRGVWDTLIDVRHRGRCVTTGIYRNRPVAILAPTLGAPAAAMTVDAAAARGVRVVLGLGFCGGVAPHLRCGDVLVPIAAVAADGASATYVPERYPAVADPYLATDALASGVPTTSGIVWTGDGVLTQTTADTTRYTDLGVAAVDMETSAVLTVARLRGIRAVTILVVSDHLGRRQPTDPARLATGVTAATTLVLRLIDHVADLA